MPKSTSRLQPFCVKRILVSHRIKRRCSILSITFTYDQVDQSTLIGPRVNLHIDLHCRSAGQTAAVPMAHASISALFAARLTGCGLVLTGRKAADQQEPGPSQLSAIPTAPAYPAPMGRDVTITDGRPPSSPSGSITSCGSHCSLDIRCAGQKGCSARLLVLPLPEIDDDNSVGAWQGTWI